MDLKLPTLALSAIILLFSYCGVRADWTADDEAQWRADTAARVQTCVQRYLDNHEKYVNEGESLEEDKATLKKMKEVQISTLKTIGETMSVIWPDEAALGVHARGTLHLQYTSLNYDGTTSIKLMDAGILIAYRGIGLVQVNPFDSDWSKNGGWKACSFQKLHPSFFE
jgi:hypothetical protein